MKSKLIAHLFAILIALMGTGCGGVRPVEPLPSVPPCELLPGQSAPLIANGGEGAETLEWYASAGELRPDKGPTVTYYAPRDYSGSVNIIVVAKRGNSSQQGQLTCTIIAPPTSTPTSTPQPSATPTLTPTITSTPLPPLLEIFLQATEGKEFVFKNNGGELNNLPNAGCGHSGPHGLQLTYNMTGLGNGGWGVQWTGSSKGHYDASAFHAITFWVKGASGGETFQIGLKDTTGRNGNGFEVKLGSKDFVVVNTGWTIVKIPFTEFKGVNTASIDNLNLGFNKDHGSGSVCIDDIAFVP